ncbi:hypothetical protein JRO89_XS10G0199400 [Xanthoceras sorbifolium]|uniref:Uncharacterized protein n=1 Tax=Xanthoceras sorbifolium TaxID=99658 RepID=A0ABQ8HJJ4_9ROSI|nr:hypothetical protein JRO89_XS10G0199400 [Xanthoceras sorbifolium]
MQTNQRNRRVTEMNSIGFYNVARNKYPEEAIVGILLSEPVHVAGMVKLHKCQNYQHLAAEINRIYSELKGVARNPNPSLLDPMPGFIVSYLPATDDLPNLDPSSQPWEIFAAALDLIIAVPI